MSKRGQALKIIKAGISDIIEGFNQTEKLDSYKDQQWVFDKIEKYLPLIQKRLEKLQEDTIPF